jgi:hypothetical protein
VSDTILLVRTGLAALVGLLLAPASARGEEERGFIGIRMRPVPVLTSAQREELGVTVDQGVVIVHVVRSGPADLSGIQAGDLLLRMNGRELPDTKSIRPEDPETGRLWGQAMEEINASLRSGTEVEVVVRREDREIAVRPVPVDAATMKRLNDEEAAAGRLPPAYPAGAPTPLEEDFEKVDEGSALPSRWFPVEGGWSVVPESGVEPANRVLRQGEPVGTWAMVLATGPGRAYADGEATVRFQPVSGEVDASGGIVFRARDADNYYLVRANALESNFRIYVVKDGNRKHLVSVEIEPPALEAWHTLSVRFSGSTFRATLDGAFVAEATDKTFASGWCGLWTKADSVTLFDDFEVAPIPAAQPDK